MDSLIETLKALAFLAAGAYLAPFVSSRFEKKKKKYSIKPELAHKIHLLFATEQLFIRHNTIARFHELQSFYRNFLYQQNGNIDDKEFSNMLREKMHIEVDSAVKCFDTQTMIEGELLKLQVEITGIFPSDIAKQYKKVIDEIIMFGSDLETTDITDKINFKTYPEQYPAADKALTEKIVSIEAAGKSFSKRIEAIRD